MNEIEKSIEVLQCIREANSNMIACADHKEIFGAAIDTAIAALEAQKVNRWIPCDERLPELEYIKNIWVTARKKGYDHRIVMRIRWDYRRFQHPNGKEISDTWEILAWKLTEYPEPYDPLADKLQKVLDREHDRISGKK